MKDIYTVHLNGFEWDKRIDKLDEIVPVYGSGVKSYQFFLENEKGQKVRIKDFALKEDKPFNTILHEVYYNRLGDEVIRKKRGIRVLPVEEKPNPDALEKGFYPNGEVVSLNMPIRWTNEPKGLIVHHHAGHVDARINSIDCIKLGIKNGYTYWCLEENGTVYMPHEADKHGYHAGHRFHRDHLGIEIMGSGRLEKRGNKFYTWFNKEIPENEVRWFDGTEKQKSGYYQKFTQAQENSLVDLIMWLNAAYESFSIENVVGHDEIRKSKNDPGGSLSMTMTEFRDKLKLEWQRRGEKY